MDGVININKPKGITSHDVVKRVKRILGAKKVGHGGTLDPEATGVLPILVGKATKISCFLINSDKEYIGIMKLGEETDTLDATGKVISEFSGPLPTEGEIIEAFSRFLGKIPQIPPMYSAKKIRGSPLYVLARRGINVEREAKEVTIYSLDLLKIEPPFVTFRALCSKGTYVRSLVSEIGKALGCGAYLSSLVRTRVGDLRIEDSISIEEISKKVFT